MTRPVLVIFILLIGSITAKSQNSVAFIEPEFMLGRVVHNYPEHPATNTRRSIFVSMGSFTNQKDSHWSNYYNQPSYGVSLSYAGVGNEDVFGHEISLIPFINLNTSRRKPSNWYFKIGVGASYFTRFFDTESNPTNEVIGSRFTWAFQLFLYKSLKLTETRNWKIGAGYLHASNGHTQLPNYGLNSAMISMSMQLFTKPILVSKSETNKSFKPDRTKHYFLQGRFGYGWHEFGGTRGPLGGPKQAIYNYSLSGGVILKQHIKIKAGLTYRLYESFLQDIEENQYPKYSENPKWSASNIYFSLGSEFILGHLGMDIEGGINIHKPFFEEFYNQFERGNDFDYWKSSTFVTRMGLKYYLITTNRLPKNNIWLGAHINANFGQADFNEVSIGYQYLIK